MHKEQSHITYLFLPTCTFLTWKGKTGIGIKGKNSLRSSLKQKKKTSFRRVALVSNTKVSSHPSLLSCRQGRALAQIPENRHTDEANHPSSLHQSPPASLLHRKHKALLPSCEQERSEVLRQYAKLIISF